MTDEGESSTVMMNVGERAPSAFRLVSSFLPATLRLAHPTHNEGVIVDVALQPRLRLHQPTPQLPRSGERQQATAEAFDATGQYIDHINFRICIKHETQGDSDLHDSCGAVVITPHSIVAGTQLTTVR